MPPLMVVTIQQWERSVVGNHSGAPVRTIRHDLYIERMGDAWDACPSCAFAFVARPSTASWSLQQTLFHGRFQPLCIDRFEEAGVCPFGE